MKTINRERGQSLIIIAIAFLGLAALAALIIDGGSLYLNRRTAQTAADAAALAGAREKCINKGDLTAVQTVATQFATENHATAVESVTIDADGAVVVQTRVQTSSFFARILGYEDNTVRATATAACFAPSSTDKLLPIAWTCRPPVGGSTDHCNIHSVPWDVFKTLLTVFNFGPGTNTNMLLTEGDGVAYQTYTDAIGGKLAYLVMDSDKFNPLIDCQELVLSGQINCDFNDDGILDVEGGANRGWLYLGEKGGAVALKDIIRYGYPDPIDMPQWFPGTNGVAASVFDAASDIKNNLALVPVFNAMCSDTTYADIPSDCPTEYQVGDLINGSNPGSTYYRVASFAPFVITCVSKGNSDKCPAKDYANINKNVKTIEGYFVSGISAGTDIDPTGFDLGVYIISLTK